MALINFTNPQHPLNSFSSCLIQEIFPKKRIQTLFPALNTRSKTLFSSSFFICLAWRYECFVCVRVYAVSLWTKGMVLYKHLFHYSRFIPFSSHTQAQSLEINLSNTTKTFDFSERTSSKKYVYEGFSKPLRSFKPWQSMMNFN